MHAYLYMGPYFYAKPEEVVQKETKRVCPNHKKDLVSRDTLFCPRCGQKITDVPFETKEKLTLMDVLNTNRQFEDRLVSFEGEDDRVMPNQHAPNILSLDTSDGAVIDHDLTTTDLDALRRTQMAWMAKKYATEFDFLKTDFPNVEVRWGIYNYWC